MNIIWYGQSCFKITSQGSKKSKQWVTLLIDPFSDKIGLKLPKTDADILLITHEHEDHNNRAHVKKGAFVIDGPGEYEIRDIFIRGIYSFHDQEQGKVRGTNTIYTIFTEDMNICHMGDFGEKELSNKQIEEMGDVDVLLVPVGGVYTADSKTAAKIISQIEPRVVVPMHYKIPGLNIDIEEIDGFLKAVGEKGAQKEDKLLLQKKDLPTDDMKIIPLNPQSKA